MPLTNFPNGVTSFGIPLIGSGPVLTTGAVFFVSSVTGNNGNIGTDATKPFATIAYALTKCTANNGDHIICMPGHTETYTGADGLDINVAGVTILGIGRGSNRPTFNFTTAGAADMNISANNVALSNFLFTGGVDALSSIVDISGDDIYLGDIEYRDVTGEATNFLNLGSGTDRCLIERLVFNGAAGAGGASCIQASGTTRLTLRDFYIDGNFSTGAINFFSSASSGVDISNGFIRNRNSVDIAVVDTVTGSTGKIGPNLHIMLTDNAANITEACTGATFIYFQPIRIINLQGESSMDTNITASTDA